MQQANICLVVDSICKLFCNKQIDLFHELEMLFERLGSLLDSFEISGSQEPTLAAPQRNAFFNS
jgi:hypothetical protein